jgi:hypothetical protein
MNGSVLHTGASLTMPITAGVGAIFVGSTCEAALTVSVAEV